MATEEISFLNESDSYCVCFIDMIGSTKVIDCCVTMMAAYRFVNLEMSKMGLPPVNYRISADYGKAIIAKSANSLTYDLFGPVLDVCSKINSKAPPNGMVVGNDL